MGVNSCSKRASEACNFGTAGKGRTGIHELQDETVREAIHAGSVNRLLKRLIRAHTPSISWTDCKKYSMARPRWKKCVLRDPGGLMAAFAYQALDANGRRKEGMIEADSLVRFGNYYESKA